MDEKLQAMLTKSRLFSPANHMHKAVVSISSIPGYDFFLVNCFYDLSSFKHYLSYLIHKLLKTWANSLDMNPDKKFDWKKFSHDSFGILDGIEWNKAYEAVENGRDSYDISINACQARLRIQRFGDILAFNIYKINKNEIHRTCQRAVQSICREPDRGNNQGVYELIHECRVDIAIEGESVQYEEKVFDFKEIIDSLKRYLPAASWQENISELIQKYKEELHKNVSIGECFGFQVMAEIVHEHERASSLNPRDRRVWRRGNIEQIDSHKFKFIEASDLRLSLKLKSSLPDSFLDKMPIDSKVHNEQLRLAEAGAIFLSCLCSMKMQEYIKRDNKPKN